MNDEALGDQRLVNRAGRQILVFIPTYQEADNIEALVERVIALDVGDVLIADDNSPDGTGKIIDSLAQRHPPVRAIHRPEKLGVGRAHRFGIEYAYDHGYEQLITLDGDFSHRPEDIRKFVRAADRADIVVGTRFQRRDSLREWNLFRKSLTHLGHSLTRACLGLPFDATGAFRLYKLHRINRQFFGQLESTDYEFFFESLAVLHANGISIAEVPIELPRRVYGRSKMRWQHVLRGVARLLRMALLLRCGFFRQAAAEGATAPIGGEDRVRRARREWDGYWLPNKSDAEHALYDLLAHFYRQRLIRPSLEGFISRYFAEGMKLLHAGCGGGEVDGKVVKYARVVGLDASEMAIGRHRKLHGDDCRYTVADVRKLPFANSTFDGVYSLGLMEHFESHEVTPVLAELGRIVTPGGRLVLMWAPAFGLSVIALGGVHLILNRVLRRRVKLHPDEPSKVRSARQAGKWLTEAGLELEEFSFGPADGFTYAIVVASKPEGVQPLARYSLHH